MTANRFNFRWWNKKAQSMLYDIILDSHIVYNIDLIVMQSIGLVDKNGKEIFEGDIIKIADSIIGYIKFENSGFFIIKKGFNNQLLNKEVNYQALEVIGNIYENPELLEEKI